jgi:hypothetical protein
MENKINNWLGDGTKYPCKLCEELTFHKLNYFDAISGNIEIECNECGRETKGHITKENTLEEA